MEKTVANRIAFAQTRDLLLEGQNVRICVQGQSMLPFFRSAASSRCGPCATRICDAERW